MVSLRLVGTRTDLQVRRVICDGDVEPDVTGLTTVVIILAWQDMII
jgi:hypothetical protein